MSLRERPATRSASDRIDDGINLDVGELGTSAVWQAKGPSVTVMHKDANPCAIIRVRFCKHDSWTEWLREHHRFRCLSSDTTVDVQI